MHLTFEGIILAVKADAKVKYIFLQTSFYIKYFVLFLIPLYQTLIAKYIDFI